MWAGHPWIYSGAIAEITPGPPVAGALVDVADADGKHIGIGTFHPAARIAVRMVARGVFSGDEGALVVSRVQRAAELRRALGLPSEYTTVFRLVNGDGDGLPGVVVDALGEVASIELSTSAAERWLPSILEALQAIGFTAARVQVPEDAARLESMAPGDRFGFGDLDRHVVVLENGIRWNLRPDKGQKTGFYSDQRENRARVAAVAAGRSVLDLCCYVGGFALNAAKAGAREVVGVDSSGPAVSVAAGTAERNGLREACTFHKEDASRFLKALEARTFDVVVLDPPKLARGREHLDDAYLKYRALNAEALRHVADGGLMFTFSCSGIVSEELFLRMVTDAAHLAGSVDVSVLQALGPGADHLTPIACPEARYLTGAMVRVRRS